MSLLVRCVAIFAVIAAVACSPKPPQAKEGAPCPPEMAAASGPIIPVATDAPAGRYTLDKAHASLIFRVNHLGFSSYTGAFKRFDATLDFDPAEPAAAHVEATIDPSSLDLNAPPPGFLDTLLGADWLDAAQFPAITFKSTSVELTGPAAARVVGDFTLHGATLPATLDVVFNGGYPGFPPYDPNARIGFSAYGTLNRSAFGIALGIPQEGSTMGVSDAVDFAIEAEFSGPPAPATLQ